MNLAFILPLVAALVLFILIGVVIRVYFNTRLQTYLFFTIFPLMFGIAMINRIILILSPVYINVYPLTMICYIHGILLLVPFIDLLSKGKITWKSTVAFYVAGSLTIYQLFLDEFIINYSNNSGWSVVPADLVYFGIFVIYAGAVIFLVLGMYLLKIYKSNKGENKRIIKQIIVVFGITGIGTGVFNVIGTLRLVDNPLINNLDSICIVLGFGFLILKYIKHPSIFHLDMVDVKLYGLFVYEKNTGVVLYQYEFEDEKIESKELIGGLFKGIDAIFKVILASDQPLKEVVHGSNSVIFNEGENLSVGLILNQSSLLVKSWLYQFRIDFEREFKGEIIEFIRCGSNDFMDKPDHIVKKIFFQRKREAESKALS